jgi:hypothetical protein
MQIIIQSILSQFLSTTGPDTLHTLGLLTINNIGTWHLYPLWLVSFTDIMNILKECLSFLDVQF